MNARTLRIQMFCDGYLQGTCLALVFLSLLEAVTFAVCHSLLFAFPLVAMLASSVVFFNADCRIAHCKGQLQILETAATLRIPPADFPRNRNVNYTVKYKQKKYGQ